MSVGDQRSQCFRRSREPLKKREKRSPEAPKFFPLSGAAVQKRLFVEIGHLPILRIVLFRCGV